MKSLHETTTASARYSKGRRGNILVAVSLSLLCAGALAQAQAPAPTLKAYGADPNQTSVSGLSSGAYMAVQLQVAYSGSIIGSGVIAGGPYYCADESWKFWRLWKWADCMGKLYSPPDAEKSHAHALIASSKKEIDDISNLTRQRIYVFSGTEDETVKPQAVDATKDFFERVTGQTAKLNCSDSAICYVNNKSAGHAILTAEQDHEKQCGNTKTPYINPCGYDQAGEILKHIYKLQNHTFPDTSSVASSERIVEFNQREFPINSSNPTDMAETGYLYVPQSCTEAETKCKVHVALHGCSQSNDYLNNLEKKEPPERKNRFHSDAGYNRWAELNNILVLYPQVNKSGKNPYGCWDWWGYTDYWWRDNYVHKSAPQMKAIMEMVGRLTEPKKVQ